MRGKGDFLLFFMATRGWWNSQTLRGSRVPEVLQSHLADSYVASNMSQNTQDVSLS